ncbi:MAG: EVE domain-containing protein [Candidatus Aenigmatarchaeota archaeon]
MNPPISSILDYFEELWTIKSIEIDQSWLEQYEAEYKEIQASRKVTEYQGATIIRNISLKVANQLAQKAQAYWIVVTSPENFKICLKNGLWGVNRQIQTIKRVKKGDILTFYIKDWRQFKGIYYVDSDHPYYDETRVWPDKLYPWRIRIRPVSQSGSIKANNIIKDLEFITNQSNWGAYSQREMIKISYNDFQRIISKMSQTQLS